MVYQIVTSYFSANLSQILSELRVGGEVWGIELCCTAFSYACPTEFKGTYCQAHKHRIAITFFSREKDTITMQTKFTFQTKEVRSHPTKYFYWHFNVCRHLHLGRAVVATNLQIVSVFMNELRRWVNQKIASVAKLMWCKKKIFLVVIKEQI